jgi:hypothetical protein
VRTKEIEITKSKLREAIVKYSLSGIADDILEELGFDDE